MSLFVHTFNSIYASTDQLLLTQWLHNDFLWKGHDKICQVVACAPISDRGLNIVYVKNLVHRLQTKWYLHLCTDVGSSWSHFIWPRLTVIIPLELLHGLHSVSETLLGWLPPFYTVIVHSYVRVNNLFYESAEFEVLVSLPHNLWCGAVCDRVDWEWVSAGFFTVADLPVWYGKVDVIAVKQALESMGCTHSPYL